MITKFEISPTGCETTGAIDEKIESVNIEAWGDSVVRIEFDYNDTTKPICGTNISKDEAVQLAKQILLYYNAL